MFRTLNGFRIVVDASMCEHKQVRFPRSKKKRIRKKWRKDIKRNWAKSPDLKVYQIGDALVMHPQIAYELRKYCDERDSRGNGVCQPGFSIGANDLHRVDVS